MTQPNPQGSRLRTETGAGDEKINVRPVPPPTKGGRPAPKNKPLARKPHGK